MGETIHLPYGRGHSDLDLSLIGGPCHIIRSDGREGESKIGRQDIYYSFDHPIGCPPLRYVLSPHDSLCIVTTDGTRPFPPQRMIIHMLFDYLGFVPERTTVITGSGSHVPHTPDELEDLFCKRLLADLNIVSHDSRSGDNVEVGHLADGTAVTMNRRYVEADTRLVLGHIEPHFLAGYTGGAKGIVPGICGIETIHRLHAFDIIDDRSSAYGRLDANATNDIIQEAVAMAPPHFLINLILNDDHEPVEIFSGEYIEAHRVGVEAVRKRSEISVDHRFPIVITTNAGYPLDQNLYQTVKGIDAASQIVEPGGTIIVVAECLRGVPSGSAFERMLTGAESIETLLDNLANSDCIEDDQWQVQRLGRILTHCAVIVVSSLNKETIGRCKMVYAESIDDAIRQACTRHGGDAETAIIPGGPGAIPVLRELKNHSGLG